MSRLAEFLKQEEERLKKERPDRASAVAEWQAASSGLLRQFEAWIRADDPHELMAFILAEKPAYESRLGKYPVMTLTVDLDGRSVTFEPKERYIGGTIRVDPGQQPHTADGRVEVLSNDMPEEEIYRIGTGDSSFWVSTLRCAGEPKYQFERLTRERFERLLLGLLQ